MKLREIMSDNVVRIHPEEPVSVAARALARYNIGALPVCGSDGRLQGVVTDRDLVTRCLASGFSPASTPVKAVMTSQVITARPDMAVGAAAHPMTEEHGIQWVYLQTDRGGQRKALVPGEKPIVSFALMEETPVSVYAYCNLHGLWKADL